MSDTINDRENDAAAFHAHDVLGASLLACRFAAHGSFESDNDATTHRKSEHGW